MQVSAKAHFLPKPSTAEPARREHESHADEPMPTSHERCRRPSCTLKDCDVGPCNGSGLFGEPDGPRQKQTPLRYVVQAATSAPAPTPVQASPLPFATDAVAASAAIASPDAAPASPESDDTEDLHAGLWGGGPPHPRQGRRRRRRRRHRQRRRQRICHLRRWRRRRRRRHRGHSIDGGEPGRPLPRVRLVKLEPGTSQPSQ